VLNMPFVRYFLDETPMASALRLRMEALYRLYFGALRKCASKTPKENLTDWRDVDHPDGCKRHPWRGGACGALFSKREGLEVVMDATSRMDVKSKELSGEKNLVSWSSVSFGGSLASNNRFSPIYEWEHGGWTFCQLVQCECQRIGIAKFYGAASR
jgi:hypothetical protein